MLYHIRSTILIPGYHTRSRSTVHTKPVAASLYEWYRLRSNKVSFSYYTYCNMVRLPAYHTIVVPW